MRHLVLVLCAAALTAAAWFLLRPADRDATTLDTSSRSSAEARADDALVREDAAATALVADEARPERSTVASGTEPDRDEPAPPLAAILGRFVDTRGRPVAGASVVLYGDEPWREGDEVPEDADRREWRASSDDDGAFRLEVPVPTTSPVELVLEPPPHFATAVDVLWWGDAPGDPSLDEGEHDVGEIVLEDAGALVGRVLDVHGNPIPFAVVTLLGDPRLSIVARCEADGSYELAHLPPGPARIRAWGQEHLAAEAVAEVSAGRTLPGPAFRLAPSPRVSGVVVDEDGRPVAGSRLVARTLSGEPIAARETDGDGRFSIPLEAAEPCTLEVVLSQHFDVWGGPGESGARFEPGQSNVRIVLRRVAQATFRVVDALTREPVEDFEAYGDVAWWSGDAEHGHHPGGVIRLPATSVQDSVTVVARGYAPLRADVQPGALADGQELALVRGGTVRGLVVSGGEPLPEASVGLFAQPIPIDPLLPAENANAAFDVDGFSRPHLLTTDLRGGFRFSALSPGTYGLRIEAKGHAPEVIRGLAVGDGELDLGSIEMEGGATLRGRVVLAPGLSPAGLEVYLDDWRHWRTLHDREGTFVVEDLAPGRHVLTVQRAHPVLAEDLSLELDLAPGEVRDVVVDARDREPCALTVHVRRGDGSAVGGLDVAVQRRDGDRWETVGWIERTDDEGRASGIVTPGRRTRVRVLSGGLPLGSGDPFVPQAGGAHETRVTVAGGELVLVFPEALDLPESRAFELRLVPEGGSDDEGGVVRWETPAAASVAEGARWTGPRCTIGEVAPGAYAVRLTLIGVERGGTPSDAYETREPLFPPLEAALEIAAGETTVFEVPRP